MLVFYGVMSDCYHLDRLPFEQRWNPIVSFLKHERLPVELGLKRVSPSWNTLTLLLLSVLCSWIDDFNDHTVKET